MESQTTFETGTSVIYGLHGRCQVVGIETKQIQGQAISFYKLEIQRSPLARVQRKEPAILIPVATAAEKGLRAPLNPTQIDAVTEILMSREYYFPLQEGWHTVQPKIEATLRKEGAIGLAKAVSYAYVLRRRQVVPGTDILRFEENVTKQMIRELSDATGESPKILEERLTKWMRPKLLADQ